MRCRVFPLFYNFLPVSMVKSQKYDNIANFGTEPRHFQLSEALSNLKPMWTLPQTWGTLLELNTESHVLIFLWN